MEEQKNLSFAEAEERDMMNSPFFSPEVNVEYRLSFVGKYVLGEKPIPSLNDKTKLEQKIVLTLQISEVNGKPVQKSWDILSSKLRGQVRQYCEDGTYLEYVFRFKKTGSGKDTQYFFTPDLKSKKEAAPAAPSSPASSPSPANGEAVKLVTVWIDKALSEAPYFEAVAEDGKEYKLKRGNCEIPVGLANNLVARGLAKIME